MFDVILVVALGSGCTHSLPSDRELNTHDGNVQSKNVQSNAQMISDNDEKLIELIHGLAEDDAAKREAAQIKLTSYPRQELIDRLTEIKKSIPKDDHRQVSMAFGFCVLGSEYETNKQFLITVLTNELRAGNIYADSDVGLINILLRKGDKSLLPVLFEATKYSDGGLTETLAGMMEEHLRDNTELFLRDLVAADNETRQSVYGHFDIENWNVNELATIKKQLLAASTRPATRIVAKEVLAAFSRRRRLINSLPQYPVH